MPKVVQLQTNFSGGELSPRAIGRVDIDRYNASAETLENVLCVVQGGVKRRDGTVFVNEVKDSTKQARVVPFVYSTSDAYVLEFGDQYVRFYKNGARLGAPYEVATPFTESILFDLKYTQSGDTMFITHPTLYPRRLRRFSDTNWVLDTCPFDPEPFDEIGHSFGASLTLSAATVGSARTVTASSGIFISGDVGREIYYLGGVLKITTYTDALHVTGDITSAFQGTAIPSSVWTLGGSPRDELTPSAANPVEKSITLTSTLLDVWRSADVGKYVRINGGIAKITSFSTAKVVNATIKRELTAATAAPADSWSLEASVWDATNGYPGSCTIHQQRLILGGSTALPQVIWGSVTGSYMDFTLGALDSDAFAYELASSQSNIIRHLISAGELFALTYGSEFSIRGGVEKPITPTNVQVTPESGYGSSAVRPVQLGKRPIFVQRAGFKVLQIAYEVQNDSYDSSDLTIISDHVTAGTDVAPGVKEMAYRQEPDPMLVCARWDGVAAVLAFQLKEGVNAWSRFTTDGYIESVCTIPVTAGDQVWAIIRRVINGVSKRYVEVFDTDAMVDSAITATVGAPTVSWSAAHLEGKTVRAYAGTYLGEYVVSGGTITLDAPVSFCTIGLSFTPKVKLLTPEFQGQLGSAQGQAMSTSKLIMSFYETSSCRVNGDLVPFQNFGGSLLDDPPPVFSGIKSVSTLGWANGESPIEITVDVPFAFHLRYVVREFTWNGP